MPGSYYVNMYKLFNRNGYKSGLSENEFFAVADVDVAGEGVVDADALEVVDDAVAGFVDADLVGVDFVDGGFFIFIRI